MTEGGAAEPCTVLLVEDHAQLRSILAKALAALGYQVLSAENGDAAVELFEHGVQPQLVFTDIRMPGTVDGLSLARWVRQRYPNCRVLLQSGYTHTDTGEFPVLRKPYSDGELRRAIELALG